MYPTCKLIDYFTIETGELQRLFQHIEVVLHHVADACPAPGPPTHLECSDAPGLA